jgi:hypothetical protein
MKQLIQAHILGIVFVSSAWSADLPIRAEALVITGAHSRTNPAALKAEVKHEEGPGMRPVNRGYVSSGTYKFGVELPGGYHVDSSAAEQVTLTSQDLTATLGLRVAAKSNQDPKGFKPEFLRDLIQDQYPTAKVTAEFVLPAACSLGSAFDLHVAGMKGTARRARVVFVPLEAGLLQFSIVASAERFNEALVHFQTLVLTFRASDRNGKLEMPVLPDRI